MDPQRVPPLNAPAVRAHFAPVYWEPLPRSRERFVGTLLIVPDPSSTTLLMPGAHVVIGARRLRAMLGTERGNSAHGILKLNAEHMTRQLLAGCAPEECAPLFKGFSVGSVRSARGFTAEQVLDVAVSLVSAFGSAEDVAEEIGEAANHSTATTREFLQRVQTAFAPADDTRRKRFGHSVAIDGSKVTIDYAHRNLLVQFTSTTTSERQAQNMRREADAKILEALTVRQQVMGGQANAHLIINTAPLLTTPESEAQHAIASDTLAHLHAMAKVHSISTVEARSHEEAALLLGALG